MCRSIWEVRRHPPDAMEEKLPGLRVVSAEIETPGHSPRNGGLASPNLAPAHSGDSFTAALRHHASRLKHAVMSQRVGVRGCLPLHAWSICMHAAH